MPFFKRLFTAKLNNYRSIRKYNLLHISKHKHREKEITKKLLTILKKSLKWKVERNSYYHKTILKVEKCKSLNDISTRVIMVKIRERAHDKSTKSLLEHLVGRDGLVDHVGHDGQGVQIQTAAVGVPAGQDTDLVPDQLASAFEHLNYRMSIKFCPIFLYI